MHKRRNIKEINQNQLNQNLSQKYNPNNFSDEIIKDKNKVSITPKFNESSEPGGSNYIFASSNKQSNYMDQLKNDEMFEIKNINSNGKLNISNNSSINKRPKSSIGNYNTIPKDNKSNLSSSFKQEINTSSN